MSTRPVEVSVLVPAKDEAENLPEFVRQAAAALTPAGFGFEVIVIDDGSTDATAAVLADLKARHPWLRSVSHRRQSGIADALRSGADAAHGHVLVFYPADLQYKPEDIRAWSPRSSRGRPTSSPGPSRGSTRRRSSRASTTPSAAGSSGSGSPTSIR
jgi:glycosyltransferase involved in cell wall biosynthesis